MTGLLNKFSSYKHSSMGNRACKGQIESKARPPVLFPAQAQLELDWNDEKTIYHRTAMNCLDNYALGKIDEESLENDTGKRKTRQEKCALQFAEQLEQTIIF
jgi:hypothetical protein